MFIYENTTVLTQDGYGKIGDLFNSNAIFYEDGMVNPVHVDGVGEETPIPQMYELRMSNGEVLYCSGEMVINDDKIKHLTAPVLVEGCVSLDCAPVENLDDAEVWGFKAVKSKHGNQLRALPSEEQRRFIICGMMCAGGRVDNNGYCIFSHRERSVVNLFMLLMRADGHVFNTEPRVYQGRHALCFTPEWDVFGGKPLRRPLKLAHKRKKLKITSIEKVREDMPLVRVSPYYPEDVNYVLLGKCMLPVGITKQNVLENEGSGV